MKGGKSFVRGAYLRFQGLPWAAGRRNRLQPPASNCLGIFMKIFLCSRRANRTYEHLVARSIFAHERLDAACSRKFLNDRFLDHSDRHP